MVSIYAGGRVPHYSHFQCMVTTSFTKGDKAVSWRVGNHPFLAIHKDACSHSGIFGQLWAHGIVWRMRLEHLRFILLRIRLYRLSGIGALFGKISVGLELAQDCHDRYTDVAGRLCSHIWRLCADE